MKQQSGPQFSVNYFFKSWDITEKSTLRVLYIPISRTRTNSWPYSYYSLAAFVLIYWNIAVYRYVWPYTNIVNTTEMIPNHIVDTTKMELPISIRILIYKPLLSIGYTMSLSLLSLLSWILYCLELNTWLRTSLWLKLFFGCFSV